MNDRKYPVIVIGGGPAGLATSRELVQRQVDHVVLERGSCAGFTWTKLYDSLTLHTGKHLSSLPGMGFPASTPLFPSRDDFVNYLWHYTDRFQLPLRTNSEVVRVERTGGRWLVQTAHATLQAAALVVATGILSTPRVPHFPGRERYRGRVLHSVDYRHPAPFQDSRVLVIGVGNSGGEIAAELPRGGADVTVAVRSGNAALPRTLLGVPIQYYGLLLSRLPRGVQRMATTAAGKMAARRRGPSPLPPPRSTPCPAVPLIGFHLTDAIRAGTIQVRPAPVEFTDTGMRFIDGSVDQFDQIILATGYRATMGILHDLVREDGCGFALREQRVRSVDHPNLYFVGHNYDTTGGLVNIARDARIVARMVREGT